MSAIHKTSDSVLSFLPTHFEQRLVEKRNPKSRERSCRLMEMKNALSSSLKDHSLSNRGNWQTKNPWHNSGYRHTCNHSRSDHECLRGCSWPPRSYPCTYCKREFRSAQALGGHMNVHRRDRARLRHSSPMDQTNTFYQYHQDHNNQDQAEHADDDDDVCPILTLNPNPNPNFAVSSSNTSSLVSPSPLVSSFLSPSCSSLGKTVSCFRPVMVKSSKPMRIHEPPPPAAAAFDQEIDLCSFRSTMKNSVIGMRNSMMGTDLKLGDSSTDDQHHNYVDLELRLGRS